MGARLSRTHNLRNNAQRIDSAMRYGLKLAGRVIKDAAQKRAPELTGQLTRSVVVSEPRWSAGRMVAYVGPGAEVKAYAKYTELPRYIALRPGLGPTSRAKGATKPWLKPTAREYRPEVEEILRASLHRSLARIART